METKAGKIINVLFYFGHHACPHLHAPSLHTPPLYVPSLHTPPCMYPHYTYLPITHTHKHTHPHTHTHTHTDHSPVAKRSSMSDRMSPMRLMNWGKGSREETLGEINRKMQRALEEALMKNIHLHKVHRVVGYCILLLQSMYSQIGCKCINNMWYSGEW